MIALRVCGAAMEISAGAAIEPLSEAEERLKGAAAAGNIANLEGKSIRSVFIELLCCGGRPDWPVAPAGVRLSGGRIVGRIELGNRVLQQPLWLHDADIPAGLNFSNSHTKTIDLSESRIAGSQAAFEANKMHVDGDLVFTAAKLVGSCEIGEASISGRFIASGATFENPGGDAIQARGYASSDFIIDDATVNGACDLTGAKITGQLSANGATLNNLQGEAITASVSNIGSWFMRSGDVEQGGKIMLVRGMINLTRAHIVHDLDFKGASLTGGHYMAIAARGLVVGGSVYFEDQTKIDGCVYFGAADIKGGLRLTGSVITSALLARTRDTDPLPPVLAGGEEHETFRWNRYAVDLSEAKVALLFMPETQEARPRGIVDLSRGRIGTFTDFKAAWPPKIDRTTRICEQRPCDQDGRDADHLVLDGFEYEHLDNPDGLPIGQTGPVAQARLDWLHGQSRDDIFERLRPQPWRQLGKVLADQGYEDDARIIAIERRVAQRYAKGMRITARVLSWLLHHVADYGFNPWKTIGWSAGVVLVFSLVYYGVAARHGIKGKPLAADQLVFVRTLPADFVPAVADPKQAEEQLLRVYPQFDPFMYSLDVFLPLVDLGTEKYWRANTTTGVGTVVYYLSIFEAFIGAVMLLLIVTGFTGLLTRDERK